MLAILQARLGSHRLPKKVLRLVNKRPIIEWQIERIHAAKSVSRLIVAIPDLTTDDELASFLLSKGVEVFRGPEEDVLTRFLGVIDSHKEEEAFIRLTADCPLFMPEICDLVVQQFEDAQVDYLSNTLDPKLPNGCDVEVIRSESLRRLNGMNLNHKEREHVTLGIYMRQQIFSCRNFLDDLNRNDSIHRWTIDTEEDLDFVRSIYSHFMGREGVFGYAEVMALIESNIVDPNLEVSNNR